MMKRLKKGDNKGFTLVELIVVLVILAILAAILVPALLGYIDRAKGQQIVLNARSCYTSAQAEMSSMYAKSQAVSDIVNAPHPQTILDTADVNDVWTGLKVGVKATAADVSKTNIHANYKVAYVEYTENGQTIYFDGASWVETVPSTSGIITYTIKE